MRTMGEGQAGSCGLSEPRSYGAMPGPVLDELPTNANEPARTRPRRACRDQQIYGRPKAHRERIE